MQTSAENITIELTVPAEERMMMVIRLTTAGVVTRANLTLDAADDVKMAVEEAAGCLIKFSGCARLRIGYNIGGDELRIYVRAECTDLTPMEQTQDELYTIRCILESMVDEVLLSGRQRGITGIELRKQLLK